eukprot:5636279-Heterocapsa_arctica.AAC.1
MVETIEETIVRAKARAKAESNARAKAEHKNKRKMDGGAEHIEVLEDEEMARLVIRLRRLAHNLWKTIS